MHAVLEKNKVLVFLMLMVSLSGYCFSNNENINGKTVTYTKAENLIIDDIEIVEK